MRFIGALKEKESAILGVLVDETHIDGLQRLPHLAEREVLQGKPCGIERFRRRCPRLHRVGKKCQKQHMDLIQMRKAAYADRQKIGTRNLDAAFLLDLARRRDLE